MKKIYSILLVAMVAGKLPAQEVFSTRHGQVSFFSKTPMENIDAVNNEVASAVNVQTGELGFAVLIKGFHFERALMEEHFNENYMESDNLPKAFFKGKINNPAAVNMAKDGAYAVTAEGDLTIHGVTKKISLPGNIVVKAGQLQLLASFKVLPREYNIRIPALVADKIATVMTVSVDCRYEKK